MPLNMPGKAIPNIVFALADLIGGLILGAVTAAVLKYPFVKSNGIASASASYCGMAAFLAFVWPSQSWRWGI